MNIGTMVLVWCYVLVITLNVFVLSSYCSTVFKYGGHVGTHEWVLTLIMLALNALGLHLNLQELKR